MASPKDTEGRSGSGVDWGAGAMSEWLARWPEVGEATRVSAGEPTEPARGVPGHPVARTFRCRGVHITSCVDRTAEARAQAAEIPPAATDAMVVGMALGDLPRVLLEERKKLKRLWVVVMNPSLLKVALSFTCEQLDDVAYEQAWSWLRDERVELLLGRAQPVLKRPFTVAPATLQLAEDAALPFRDRVLLALSERFEAQVHGEREPMVQASMNSNEEKVQKDRDVAALFGTMNTSTAVVAAGGPTLTEGIDWIHQHREQLTLVAVSTALMPLEQAGLTPEFVVVVDPKPALMDHFRCLSPARYSEVALVYTPAVQPAVLDWWPGSRYAAYLPQQRFQEMRARIPRGELFCGATVTHAAVDLGVKLGAQRVVMWGADFAYLGGRSHAEGAAQERGLPSHATATVVTGRGTRAPSDLSLISFLRDLERYVSEQPRVRFLVGSRRGAKISGTEFLAEGECD